MELGFHTYQKKIQLLLMFLYVVRFIFLNRLCSLLCVYIFVFLFFLYLHIIYFLIIKIELY